jgi:hypothetical protein
VSFLLHTGPRDRILSQTGVYTQNPFNFSGNCPSGWALHSRILAVFIPLILESPNRPLSP